jgi:hypothetical protein
MTYKDRKDYDNTKFAFFDGIFGASGAFWKFPGAIFRYHRGAAFGARPDPKLPENPRTHPVGDTPGAVISRESKGSFRMRGLRAAAVMVLLLAGPAYAQIAAPAAPTDPPKSATQIDVEKSADRAYKNSLGNIPDKPPADPWGGARTMDAPKPAPAPAPPQAKRTKTHTGSATN